MMFTAPWLEYSKTAVFEEMGITQPNLPGRLEKYKEVVEIGLKLAYYRLFLIETVDRVAFSYRPVMKDLAKRNGLSWNDIVSLTHEELKRLFADGYLTEDYKSRGSKFGVVRRNGKVEVITGKAVDDELSRTMEKVDTDISEFTGMVAFRGKARGEVRVIEDARNISSLKQGQILVASETTPDYIVGMKKAGAIVTNQGGITSHAAIVSRELGIPCIIGTKIATQVLKDGDEVEVGADEGVVTVLRRAKKGN